MDTVMPYNLVDNIVIRAFDSWGEKVRAFDFRVSHLGNQP